MQFHRLVDLHAFDNLLYSMHMYGTQIRSTQKPNAKVKLSSSLKDFQIAVFQG